MYLSDDFAPRYNVADEGLFDKLFGDTEALEEKKSTCGCDGCGRGAYGETFGLEGKPIAMVYSVLQDFDGLYDKEMALSRGTIFKELDLPFLGGTAGSFGSQCNNCGGGRNG